MFYLSTLRNSSETADTSASSGSSSSSIGAGKLRSMMSFEEHELEAGVFVVGEACEDLKCLQQIWHWNLSPVLDQTSCDSVMRHLAISSSSENELDDDDSATFFALPFSSSSSASPKNTLRARLDLLRVGFRVDSLSLSLSTNSGSGSTDLTIDEQSDRVDSPPSMESCCFCGGVLGGSGSTAKCDLIFTDQGR
nr:hypothetical protein Iba_chr13dCG7560 [Ipomoea batatas]